MARAGLAAPASPRRRVPPEACHPPLDPAATNRIEVVLPLKPHNGARGSDLRRVREALLPSFNRFCDPSFVARFTIVAPDADLDQLTQLQESSDLDLTIIGENALLGGPPAAMPWHGWFVQQMVKIAYGRVCRTPFYLTLDADTFLTDSLDERLFDHARAPAHMEPHAAHPLWWPASAEALLAQPVPPDQPVLGVTPAFLSAEIMRRVIDRLSRVAAPRGLGWTALLAALAAEGDRCWTEYSLYWTTLINTADPATLHHPRDTYVFCQSRADAATRIRLGAGGDGPLFGVIQSAFVSDAAHVAQVNRLLRQSESANNPRRRLGWHGGYHYLAPAQVRATLVDTKIWLVSASANADPLAALVEPDPGPAAALIRRTPQPPPTLPHPNLRVVYVVDDPGAAIAAMLDGRQIDICRTNNINFVPAFWRDLTATEYVGAGEDLLNLIDHVRNWTDPEGPLGRAVYQVLILRLSHLPRHVDTLLDFLDLPANRAAPVRRRLQTWRPTPPPDPALRDWIAALYAPLCAYIDALPGAALWDGAAGVLSAFAPA